MPGTKTAGDIGVDTPEATMVSFHLIDASGDLYSQSYVFPVAPTLVQIETLSNSYQTGSQASLYKVELSQVWEGAKLASNATNDQRSGKENGINLSMRNPSTGVTVCPRIVAPVEAAMQSDADIPIITADPLLSIISAFLARYGIGYSLQHAQYTTRVERTDNPRVKP